MSDLDISTISGSQCTFAAEEFVPRIQAAKAALQKSSIDVMIVTGPENIYYLTGQQTPGYYTFQAMLLPVDGDPVFVLRQLEYFNFLSNTHITDAKIYTDGDNPIDFLVSVIQEKKWTNKHIGIDKNGWFLPIRVYEALTAKLGEIKDAAGIIENLRAVKSPAEVAKIEKAASYVDAGMTAGLAQVKVGNSENDFVSAMLGASIAAGSEYLGMEPLVSCGPRSGFPHSTWRRRKIQQNEGAFLEMSACHDRYHAALMRSAWVGTPPAKALEMEKVLQEALQAALDALKPGEPCEVSHNACQAVIDKYGYTDSFKKRTGYSIGIAFAPDWGEWAVLSLYKGIMRPLEPGMTFHIPPALRVYGQFTVGVSETVVITDTGYRALGHINRAMKIVD